MRLEHLEPGLHGEQQAVLNLQLGQLLVPLLQLLGEGRVAAAHKVLDQLHGPSRQDAVRCRGEAKADRGRTERVDGPALLWYELHRRLEQACSLRRLTQVLPGTFGPGRTTSVLGRLRGARRSRAERSAVEERARRQRSRRREARQPDAAQRREQDASAHVAPGVDPVSSSRVCGGHSSGRPETSRHESRALKSQGTTGSLRKRGAMRRLCVSLTRRS